MEKGECGSRAISKVWMLHSFGREYGARFGIITVRRIFSTVNFKLESPRWAEFWIAFEAAVNTKEALQIAKELLSKFPNSLRLWSAYAYLQRIRGKSSAARKVYETCLIQNAASPSSWSGGDASAASERSAMWFAWAEMEWLEKQNEAALRVLFAAVNVPFSPELQSGDSRVALLRARKAYDLLLQTSDGAGGSTKASLLFCLSLMELIHTNDIPRTLDLISDGFRRILLTSSLLTDPSSSSDNPAEAEIHRHVLEERISMRSALLLYRYAFVLRNANRPMDIRQSVAEAIKKHPGNTLILGAWLESERGEAVWGRVRAAVADVVLQLQSWSGGSTVSNSGPNDALPAGRSLNISPARWMWAAWVETWERGVWDSGRVRRLLRQALETPQYSTCPALWRALLMLEFRSSSPAAVYGLVYQASAACPWVKDFYMYAFRILRSRFSADELRKAVDTMAERGIRLRAVHSLEDYLAGNVDGSDDSDEESGNSEVNEIEITLFLALVKIRYTFRACACLAG
ncbi:hypothetical protein DL93DRAFT_551181 [Clavulina sp. PMI_390]|nr:hypothetical protein DL93DRAFT_551181 [Clavulina sp. PMI_390]